MEDEADYLDDYREQKWAEHFDPKGESTLMDTRDKYPLLSSDDEELKFGDYNSADELKPEDVNFDEEEREYEEWLAKQEKEKEEKAEKEKREKEAKKQD